MKKKFFYLLTLLIVLLLVVFLFLDNKEEELSNVIDKDNEKEDLVSVSLSDLFENINADFMSFSDWSIEKLDGEFVCEVTPAESSHNIRVVEKIIDSDKYCVAARSEGAAGSTYTEYVYSTVKNDELIVLDFTVKYPRCSNYNEIEGEFCETERENFDLDTEVKQIIDIYTEGLTIGDSCRFFGGNWLEEFNECEYISKSWCDNVNGEFNECGSACRNDADAEICTLQCVPFCKVE
jgi:hypothetical protein